MEGSAARELAERLRLANIVRKDGFDKRRRSVRDFRHDPVQKPRRTYFNLESPHPTTSVVVTCGIARGCPASAMTNRNESPSGPAQVRLLYRELPVDGSARIAPL